MSNTTIQLRKSGQTGNTPADLAHGELAINYADGKLFYKNGVGIKSIENQKTFSTINANNSLVIATSPTDILSLEAGSNILLSTNTITKTITISVPGGSSIDTLARDIATNAYNEANTQNVINQTQNTWIADTNTFAQAAYNQANTAPTQLQTSGIRTNASYFPLFVNSNNAVLTAESIYSTGAGITFNPSTNAITATSITGTLIGSAFGTIGSFSTYVELTGDNDYIEWGASDDVRMMYSGVANTINLQLYSDVISFKVVDNANTADRFIFYKANGDLRLVSGNVIFSDGTVQRTESLTAAQAAFNSANAGVTLATAAYEQANNASGNTVALQAQMSTTNTNITSVNTFAGSAFNSANAGVTLATAAFGTANTAAGNTVALQAQMSTTNTNVAAVNTFTQAAFNSANAGVTLAQSAYNTANLKFNTTGGTITGSVTIQNNLVVQGNLSVLGNSTTISTSSLAISDPLIFLANGNIVTDTVDVGVIGHYGGPSGETHTGIFRDPNLKEWIIFQGYTTQIQSNNLINIADPSFAYANLYANVVKSNLISTYAVVNGLNVFSTMSSAFASANAGVTLATAAYGAANTAAGNTVALQAQMTTTNTNITSVNTFAGSAFNSANAGVTLATAAYGAANNASGNTVALQAQMSTTNTNITSVNTFAGSAFNSANAGVTLATAAYAQANSASGNTIALQAQMSTTNTNITSVNTFAFMASFTANSAWTSANAGVTLATAAYAQANSASGNTIALQAQMSTTNTNVAAVNTFAQAGFNKANGAVQIGFTTISANSVSITPASNADTLTISAGNNVTISACNTTKTITIGSTGGGSGTTTTVLTDVRRTVATAGQTLFSVPIYEIGSNTIRIFINGVRQNNIIDYTETSTSTITLVDPAAANDNVVFEVTAFDTTLTPNQNTWINNTDTLARAAYNQANTTPSTINTRGIQTNASYFPIFVDANAAIATAESLFSHGNLTYNPSTGTCSATIFSATSDESLKENIKTIEDPINIIRQLRGVTYTWKNTKEESIGLIAQEVEKVLPIVIRESGDKKTIDYPNMIGLLVEAIKEQQKQIDELKRKIDGTSN